MNRKGNCTNIQGRSTLRLFTHHLLVDILPTLMLLAAMAFGMAMISSKMPVKQIISGIKIQLAKSS